MFSSAFKLMRAYPARTFSHSTQPYIFSSHEPIIWLQPKSVSPFADIIAVYQDVYTLEVGENNYILCKSGEVIRKYNEVPKNWIFPAGLSLPRSPKKSIHWF